MKQNIQLHRRAFIRGVGAGLVAAPFMFPRRGWAASEVPKRLICIVRPNGPVPQMFWPNGGPGKYGPLTSMNTCTAALLPYKDKLLFLGNVDGRTHMNSAPQDPNSHTAAWLVSLTGAHPIGGGSGFASGPSIDHVVGSSIFRAARTPQQALHLWVSGKKDVRVSNSRISYSAAGAPNDPYLSPYAAFDAVFQGITGDAASSSVAASAAPSTNASASASADDVRRRRRCRVVDRVRAELKTLRARVGTEDAARLEQHITSVNELEGQLRCAATTPEAPGGSADDPSQPVHSTPVTCGKPSLAAGLDPAASKNYEAMSKMHMDVLVTALACDITRVATLQYSAGSGTGNLPVSVDSNGSVTFGSGSGHHDQSHVFGSSDSGKGSNGEPAAFVAINKWYYEQLAYLLNKLDSTPEPFGGAGTMLDNTLVFSVEDLGGGTKHYQNNRPYIFAGMSDKINAGQYVDSQGGSPSQVLVSVANVFGLNVDRFGFDGAGHTGEISGLRK